MALFGMKDSANMILINKRTKKPELYIDYANSTTSEWSSETVYATKKGTNAIAWDGARNGTLTVETEMFDLPMLAMTLGSKVEQGVDNIFRRVAATLDEDRQVKINDGHPILEESISVYRLSDERDGEHIGEALFNSSMAKLNLPKQVKDVSLSAQSNQVTITFPQAAEATNYKISRNGEVVATQSATEYIDKNLTAETRYTYVVTSVNEFGDGPASAEVVVTTPAEGVLEPVSAQALPQAKTAALKNEGKVAVAEEGAVTYSLEDGILTFNEQAVPGDAYAVYFIEKVDGVKTLNISSKAMVDNYEIIADTQIKEDGSGAEKLVQIRYFNAKPQSNFTLTQSATEPTSFSIVFDLMPEGNDLAEFKIIQ